MDSGRSQSSPHLCHRYRRNGTLAGLVVGRMGLQQEFIFTWKFEWHASVKSIQPSEQYFAKSHSSSDTELFTELKKWKLPTAEIIKRSRACSNLAYSCRADLIKVERCRAES